MIEKATVGLQCWIITDLWETLCAVPVTVISGNVESGEFVCRWQITEEYSEDYEGREPKDMYATEQEAKREISAQRRLEQCRNQKPYI